MLLEIADLPEVKYRPQPLDKNSFVNKYAKVKDDWRINQRIRELEPVHDDLTGTHFHSNYMEYLEVAWANHYGVVMTPDVLWHALMSEAVLIVSGSPDEYASLFTETPDKKQTVIVSSGSMTVMPLDTLKDSVKNLLPTESALFFPEFSTSTDRSRFARYAAFLDLVSPYYSYGMFMCGIPKIDIRGKIEEYDDILKRWAELGKLLSGNEEYFDRVHGVLSRLIVEFDRPGFWKEMFYLERCGSGSQTEVFGWWTDLYKVVPKVKFSKNYSTHLSRVCYTQLQTKKDYEMYHGLFASDLKGDMLEPDFGCVVYEKLKTPVVSPLKMEIETTIIGGK